MRELAQRYKHKPVLMLGCIDYVKVAHAYGFRCVFTVADLVNAKPSLWPFFNAQQLNSRMHSTADEWTPAEMKPKWPDEPIAAVNPVVGSYSGGLHVGQVIQLTDAVDWAPELQVTLDVLRGGCPLGCGDAQAIPLYSSNADFTFQGAHGSPRLAGGSFIHCLEALFSRSCPGEQLSVEYYGKPFISTYRFTENVLREQARALQVSAPTRIWAIGDNPASDIRGANNAGEHWSSVLVKTGVWQGWRTEENCVEDPAIMVADDVHTAVQRILELAAETSS